ncbi:MAG: hypothetical protein AAFU64_13520 [Bacteroidota bacterium]
MFDYYLPPIVVEEQIWNFEEASNFNQHDYFMVKTQNRDSWVRVSNTYEVWVQPHMDVHFHHSPIFGMPLSYHLENGTILHVMMAHQASDVGHRYQVYKSNNFTSIHFFAKFANVIFFLSILFLLFPSPVVRYFVGATNVVFICLFLFFLVMSLLT